MYVVTITNGDDVFEALSFSYVEEAEAVATAFENMTDYTVIREWEEEE